MTIAHDASWDGGSSSSAATEMDPAQMAEAADAASGLLRLLANTNRLMILCFLLERERSVGQMEEDLGIRQPTLSQQIAILREARLIGQSRREAKVVFYELRDPKVIPIIQALYGVFCAGAGPKPESNPEQTTVGTEAMVDTAREAPSVGAVDSPAGVSSPVVFNLGSVERASADCGVMAVLDSR